MRRESGIGLDRIDEVVGCDRVVGRDRFRAAPAVFGARGGARTARDVKGLIGSRGLVGGRSRSIPISSTASDGRLGLVELIGFGLGWCRGLGSTSVEVDRFCAGAVAGRARKVDRFRSRLVLGSRLGRCRRRSVLVGRVPGEAAHSVSTRARCARSLALCQRLALAVFDRGCDRDLAVGRGGRDRFWHELLVERLVDGVLTVSVSPRVARRAAGRWGVDRCGLNGVSPSISPSEGTAVIGLESELRGSLDWIPLVGVVLCHGPGPRVLFVVTPAVGDCPHDTALAVVPLALRRYPGSRGFLARSEPSVFRLVAARRGAVRGGVPASAWNGVVNWYCRLLSSVQCAVATPCIRHRARGAPAAPARLGGAARLGVPDAKSGPAFGGVIGIASQRRCCDSVPVCSCPMGGSLDAAGWW